MSTRKLKLLQRQVAWQARFCLTVVDDLQDAARDGDAGAACYLMQALVASALTLSHSLWPGGRRITDHLVVELAAELRASLGVDESSPLASQRLAPLGTAIYFTHVDCAHFFDLRRLTVNVDGEIYPLRPVIEAVRYVWEQGAALADQIPRVETAG